MATLTVRKEAYRIIYWQLILIMGLALILFLLQGMRSGLSALSGGLACWLPTLLFVWRVFSGSSAARAAKQFMLLFVVGETFKLLLCAILFVLIVNYLPVNILSVLIGFVGAVTAFFLAAMLLLTRHVEVSQ
ncbi:MAG: ATP synthase F0, I subunit [uncultured bacterium]|nr:MAG: ATP synthase F0, I subunit [uncultured bacterium]